MGSCGPRVVLALFAACMPCSPGLGGGVILCAKTPLQPRSRVFAGRIFSWHLSCLVNFPQAPSELVDDFLIEVPHRHSRSSQGRARSARTSGETPNSGSQWKRTSPSLVPTATPAQPSCSCQRTRLCLLVGAPFSVNRSSGHAASKKWLCFGVFFR